MKKIAQLLAIPALLLGFVLLQPGLVLAQVDPFGEACNPNNLSGTEPPASCNIENKDPLSGADGDGILIKASRIVATVTGAAAVVVIMIAGLQYILSAGDATKIRQSRDVIIYAIIGLVVALTAHIIISFVIGRF